MRHSHCAVQDQVPVLQMSGLEYNGIAWWQIFLHWDSNPAHSSVKRVPGLVLHNGCVSLSTNGSCGTSSTHTGNGRHSWYLLRAPCPGFSSLRCTGTSYLLSTQVRNAPLLCVCVWSTTTHSLLKGHVGSDYIVKLKVCVWKICVVVWQSLPPSIPSLRSFSPSLYLSLAISFSLDHSIHVAPETSGFQLHTDLRLS